MKLSKNHFHRDKIMNTLGPLGSSHTAARHAACCGSASSCGIFTHRSDTHSRMTERDAGQCENRLNRRHV